MKILIVGSTGMLGNTFKEYLKVSNIEFETLDRTDIDLSTCSFIELKNKIVNSDCDILVNCAGLIKQRKNINMSDFISVNSLLPHRLADICSEYKIKMIHITTDCVFTGESGFYNENSTHNVNDDYGKSKSMGEPINCMVVRTSIIGEEYRNKLSLLEWVKSNKGGEVNGFKNHLWNGLTCLQLSKLIINIVEKNEYWLGVRHIFSNSINKYELLKSINEIYKLEIVINPMSDKISIDRTLSSIYDITKYNIPNIIEQIRETKDFHKKIFTYQ